MAYKVFSNGDALNASELNTYLMNQSVIQFASTTARDAALAPAAEGQLVWLQDVNKYTYYTGSAWADLISTTLSSPTFTGASLEAAYTTATGFAGYTFDATTNGAIQFITANSTANGTVNIRSTSTVSINTLIAVNQSLTIVLAITNGATPYYPTAWQIDGTAVTPKWSGGVAPTAGSASAIDIYTLNIIKTAATPTYTVLASQIKFA